jgi:predicted AlkP superfamily phosphohydrolase/phosphomutase
VNVPPSYPLRPVNGYVVGCLLTPPGERLADPPSVTPLLDDYVVDLKAPRQLRADMTTFTERSTSYLAALVDMTRRRTDATLRLATAHPTDVLCVVFYSPDRVQHNFWDELTGREVGNPAVMDAIARVYRALDEAIGRLVDQAGPDATVILVSDHGFVPRPARSVRVNRWLAGEGLVAEHAYWRLRRSIVGRLPERLRRRYITLDRTGAPRGARAGPRRSTTRPGIWVHVRGRYPLGTVGPVATTEAVRAHVVRGPRPAGRTATASSRVYPREALYSESTSRRRRRRPRCARPTTAW